MAFRLFFSALIILTNFCFGEEITVVLTGTSEIGQELVKEISKKNEKVLVIGRDKNKLKHLSQKYKCHTLTMDYNNSDDIENLNQYLKNKNTTIAGFVIITPRPLFADKALPSEDSWLGMFQLCYTRPLEILKISLPYFNKDAQVVILSGTTSVQASPQYASYGVLRKMWLAEAKSLAWELGAKGISVNSVSPGLVMTSHHLKTYQEEANSKNIPIEKILDEKAKSYPSQKMTTKKDVAKAICFFLSGNSNITGQNLVVDGGLSQVY